MTVEVSPSERYGVFFNMRRLGKLGADYVELSIISAFPFDPEKPNPAIGKIRFRVLVSHTLAGTKPKIPPK